MTNSEQPRPQTDPKHRARAWDDLESGERRGKRHVSLNPTIAQVALGVVIGATIGALAVYGMNHLSGNVPPHETAAGPQSAGALSPAAGQGDEKGDGACASSVARAKALEPFAKGDLAALKLTATPKLLPNLAFQDAAGRPVTLADFKGRLLLVNLWATWCVPCRKEMPELDHLEGALGGPDFQVVAINLDTRDPDKPAAFLREIGVSHLANFADPKGQAFPALRAVGRGFGLPTTLLVDGQGCELGFLAGPAAWGGAEAQALVKAAISSEHGSHDAAAQPPG